MNLRKLSDTEMLKVGELAEKMRDKGKDKHNLGHAVLYLSDRNKRLEDLLVKTDYYLRFGMGTKELTAIRMAVEHLREMDEEVNDDSSMFV